MAPSINQVPVAVPTAQPTAPRRGKPRLPNTSSQLTTILKASAPRAITITGVVWLMLVV